MSKDFSETAEYTVNRVEVIDWTKSSELGQAFSKWLDTDMNVGFDVQDDGRTLKIFLTDKETQ